MAVEPPASIDWLSCMIFTHLRLLARDFCPSPVRLARGGVKPTPGSFRGTSAGYPIPRGIQRSGRATISTGSIAGYSASSGGAGGLSPGLDQRILVVGVIVLLQEIEECLIRFGVERVDRFDRVDRVDIDAHLLARVVESQARWARAACAPLWLNHHERSLTRCPTNVKGNVEQNKKKIAF